MSKILKEPDDRYYKPTGENIDNYERSLKLFNFYIQESMIEEIYTCLIEFKWFDMFCAFMTYDEFIELLPKIAELKTIFVRGEGWNSSDVIFDCLENFEQLSQFSKSICDEIPNNYVEFVEKLFEQRLKKQEKHIEIQQNIPFYPSPYEHPSQYAYPQIQNVQQHSPPTSFPFMGLSSN